MHQIATAGLILLLGCGYSLTLSGWERIRLALDGKSGINLLNVWVLAGAVTLPAGWLAVFVVLLHVADWPVRKAIGSPLKEHLFTTVASITAAVLAGSVVDDGHPSLLTGAAAVTIFAAVNAAVVAARMLIDRNPAALRVFLVPANHAAELVTTASGVLLGSASLWHPVLAMLGVPFLLAVHRSVLIELIGRTRSYDRRTGLHGTRLWMAKANEIVNKDRYAAVILIDTHGSRERQVPHIIKGAGLRGTDPIGRYDGGWFAVATRTGSARCGGEMIADRMHTALDHAGVQAAIGVCCERDWPLPLMLLAAEADLESSRDLDASAP